MATMKIKIPKALGACADRLYEVRAARIKQQKVADALAAEESALKEHIINTLPKSQASGVAGKVARVSVETKEVPSVRDWNKLFKHILKTKSFELLQRRVSVSAVEERWESNKMVPGVEKFKAVTVSITKV
jgi:hypothetical protein